MSFIEPDHVLKRVHRRARSERSQIVIEVVFEFVEENGPLGIIFSVAAILVGCLYLLLDFSSIEDGVRSGAPEKASWLAAFGLTLSLVWIYLELLRFLSYFYSRD